MTPPIFDRLIGLETEYAIRRTPADADGPAPAHDLVYAELREAVEARTRSLPGGREQQKRIFTENGGSIYYEALPHAPDAGLVEGGTPECRGPSQLLLYQRAQDRLLAEAARDVTDRMAVRGRPCEVALLKNCRDAFGNVYATHENFEVEIAQGPWLVVWRLGLVALLPLVAVTTVAAWLFIAAMLLVVFTIIALLVAAYLVGWALPGTGHRKLEAMFERASRRVERVLGRVDYAVSTALGTPLYLAFGLLVGLAGFRHIRGGATAFLVSRAVFSGAGSVRDDGGFELSERAGAMRRVIQ